MNLSRLIFYFSFSLMLLCRASNHGMLDCFAYLQTEMFIRPVRDGILVENNSIFVRPVGTKRSH